MAYVGSKTAQVELTRGRGTTKDGPGTLQEVLGTKSRGARRHQGGTREIPRRHQGGTEYTPRDDLQFDRGPRADISKDSKKYYLTVEV